jgi:hypothetical protein
MKENEPQRDRHHQEELHRLEVRLAVSVLVQGTLLVMPTQIQETANPWDLLQVAVQAVGKVKVDHRAERGPVDGLNQGVVNLDGGQVAEISQTGQAAEMARVAVMDPNEEHRAAGIDVVILKGLVTGPKEEHRAAGIGVAILNPVLVSLV